MKKTQSPGLIAVWACVVFLLSFSSLLFAQSERARIVGIVTDPQSAVVVGAKVSVTNTATGVVTTTVTDSDRRAA